MFAVPKKLLWSDEMDVLWSLAGICNQKACLLKALVSERAGDPALPITCALRASLGAYRYGPCCDSASACPARASDDCAPPALDSEVLMSWVLLTFRKHVRRRRSLVD